MVEALEAEHSDNEACAVSRDRLGDELGVKEQERILEQLRNPTIVETAHRAAIREAAALILFSPDRDRRSGLDRRNGLDRRSRAAGIAVEDDRRSLGDRRIGRDRRQMLTT